MAYVDENKDEILKIIDGWNGKLTWNALAVELQDKLKLQNKPSRHTLILHDEIKHAFDLKKDSLKNKRTDMIHQAKDLIKNPDSLSEFLSSFKNDDATIMALINQAKKLDKENKDLAFRCERLEKTNAILMEQFARWQSNLSKMENLDMNKLMANIDEPLPEKNVR